MGKKLSEEIRDLRRAAGFTLRDFGRRTNISAAHLSDIEHGRRLPSDEYLLRIAKALHHVGGSYEHLKSLDARLDPELSEWVSANPEVGQMLREARSSKRDPKEILERLRKSLRDNETKKKDASE
ncbi:MAG: helix-turn-helix domain-containing protein [candidate division Zixibacteria bacterium]|nr:helix-turn-helix domain-containing protein [candidate division Zixibacteria bacterium]